MATEKTTKINFVILENSLPTVTGKKYVKELLERMMGNFKSVMYRIASWLFLRYLNSAGP